MRASHCEGVVAAVRRWASPSVACVSRARTWKGKGILAVGPGRDARGGLADARRKSRGGGERAEHTRISLKSSVLLAPISWDFSSRRGRGGNLAANPRLMARGRALVFSSAAALRARRSGRDGSRAPRGARRAGRTGAAARSSAPRDSPVRRGATSESGCRAAVEPDGIPIVKARGK